MTTPPSQPGQPGQPQPDRPGQPNYGQPGQPPQPGFTGQPDFTGQPGQVPPPGGFAPVAGQPAPAPQAPKKDGKLKHILITVGVVVAVAVVGGLLANQFKDKDSGTSVESSPIGSCITTSGTTVKVETKAVDCDSDEPSFIVGAKLAESDECIAAGYAYAVYEYGRGASDQVLCLVPNYQVGTCYEESQFSMSVELKTVDCSEGSGMMTARYKITEQADAPTVSNCTDAATQKVLSFEVRSNPARQYSVCAEILGDYTWE